jgi:23S rRNA (guanosine2251-2'-O)-methyltransferase
MSTAKFTKEQQIKTLKQSGRQSERKRTRPGEAVFLYGHHAAFAALANTRREILGVYASKNMESRASSAVGTREVHVEILAPKELNKLVDQQAVHQGIIVKAAPLATLSLSDIIPQSPLIALDQVTDPRNFGAILRVAAAFKTRAVITTRQHRPAESGLIAKAASGGCEYVPIIEEANLVRTLKAAKDAGYWVVGLDGEGGEPFGAIAGHQPLIIVLGSEGHGIRRLTREACDGIYRITLPGPIESLNVASAAAIALQIHFSATGSR